MIHQFLNTRSLAFRTAIIYLTLFLVGLGLVGILMLRYSATAIIESAEKEIVHTSELVTLKVDEYLNVLTNDIEYLASNPMLQLYLKEPSDEHYLLLASDYLSLIESKPDFAQIRFIGVADDGKELVRVDRSTGSCHIVPQDQLQSKGDRSYVSESLLLPPDELYFSDIDLNKEFGQISIPYTPTLRVAKAIYQDDHVIGVIVINTNLSRLFSTLKGLVGKDYALRIANADGYYILHEDNDSTFTFEFDQNGIEAIAQLNITSLSDTREDKIIIHKDELQSIGVTNVTDTDRLYHMVIGEKSQLLRSYYRWRNNSALIILSIAGLFLLIAFWILKRQSSYLAEITHRMREFPKSRKLENLPTHRDDEIGELAKSLHEMGSIINQQLATVEEAKDLAMEAVKEKSEFIENMSHEIRNPLQSIMGITTMLEDNDPKPSQVAMLNSLKFNTDNLRSLVNNILDFQNVIKGNISLSYQWIDIGHLISEAYNSAAYAAAAKGVRLTKSYDQQLDQIECKIDQLRISQILHNLLSNAIKYTDASKRVTISARLIDTTNDHVKIRFAIEDEGRGMTPEELATIKTRYVSGGQSDPLTSSYGIGLTIVNELLETFDSELEIQSSMGKGSTFSFVLSTQSRAATISTATAQSPSLRLKGLRILVIEDDEQISRLYRHFFDEQDQIVSYSDHIPLPRDGEPYDVVISDYRLAQSTLSEEVEHLRKIVDSDTPLIVISATTPDLVVLREHFHYVNYIRKPFKMHQLGSEIIKAITVASYGYPNFDHIKHDYDHQHNKIARAMELMHKEWKRMQTRLSSAIKDLDVEVYKATLHKMITTIRRLELVRLETRLQNVQEVISCGDQLSEDELIRLQYALEVYADMIYQETLSSNVD